MLTILGCGGVGGDGIVETIAMFFYFFSDDRINGFGLWISDEIKVGTYVLKDISPSEGITVKGVKSLHYVFFLKKTMYE